MPTRCPLPALRQNVIIPLLRTIATRIAAATAATVITTRAVNFRRAPPARSGSAPRKNYSVGIFTAAIRASEAPADEIILQRE
jgi:hypothetical protein